jgi:hypothetical protein
MIIDLVFLLWTSGLGNSFRREEGFHTMKLPERINYAHKVFTPYTDQESCPMF